MKNSETNYYYYVHIYKLIVCEEKKHTNIQQQFGYISIIYSDWNICLKYVTCDEE